MIARSALPPTSASGVWSSTLLLRAGRVEARGPTRETLSYANLKRVFETEIYVDVNDLTGSLVVTPLSGRARAHLERSRP